MRRSMPLAILAVLGALIGVGGSVTFGAFSNSATNPDNTIAAERVYSGSRATTAWEISDAADRSPENVSDPVASTTSST